MFARLKQWWANNLLCLLQCHKWDMPGGHCEGCGKCDDFFGKHEDCSFTPFQKEMVTRIKEKLELDD